MISKFKAFFESKTNIDYLILWKNSNQFKELNDRLTSEEKSTIKEYIESIEEKVEIEYEIKDRTQVYKDPYDKIEIEFTINIRFLNSNLITISQFTDVDNYLKTLEEGYKKKIKNLNQIKWLDLMMKDSDASTSYTISNSGNEVFFKAKIEISDPEIGKSYKSWEKYIKSIDVSGREILEILKNKVLTYISENKYYNVLPFIKFQSHENGSFSIMIENHKISKFDKSTSLIGILTSNNNVVDIGTWDPETDTPNVLFDNLVDYEMLDNIGRYLQR